MVAPATWNLEKERSPSSEEETEPSKDDKDDEKEETKEDENEQGDGMHTIMTFGTSNVTSAHTNQRTILERKTHVQLLQEHCLTLAQSKGFQTLAVKEGNRFEGGRFDPEHGKASAGVGIMCMKDITLYPLPNPSKDDLDVVAIGGCIIHCMDIGGATLTKANTYGCTAAKKGMPETVRTDDLLPIAQL